MRTTDDALDPARGGASRSAGPWGRVRRQWRWGVVAVLCAVLLSLPWLARTWPADAPEIPPTALRDRVLASTERPYSGYVETWGGLRIPETRILDDEAGLVSRTSHLRAWVASPESWRVDQLSTVGERDIYRIDGQFLIWESNRQEAEVVQAGERWRLPAAYDLLPPELGRRLLASATDAELSGLEARRTAGRTAVGLRITPDSPDTTIRTIDLYVDADSGVPLEVSVVSRLTGREIVSSRFVDVDLSAPDPSHLRFEPSPLVDFERDISAEEVLGFVVAGIGPLPLDEFDGLARRTHDPTAVATFGEGFDVVTVVRLPRDSPANRYFRAIPVTARPWGGSARVLATPFVSALTYSIGDTRYVMAGLVTIGRLDQAAEWLRDSGLEPTK